MTVTTLFLLLVCGVLYSFAFQDYEKWIQIVYLVCSLLISLGLGAMTLLYIKVGGAIVGGSGGLVLGLLLNDACFYNYQNITLSYFVMLTLFLTAFSYCLLSNCAFNAVTVLSTSFLGSFMVFRGAAVYLGSFPNDLVLLALIRQGQAAHDEDDTATFWAWFSAIIFGAGVAAIIQSKIVCGNMTHEELFCFTDDPPVSDPKASEEPL